MVTYRSIMRMQDNTLPRKLMKQLGTNSILAVNIMKRLGGGRVSHSDKQLQLRQCNILNSNRPAIKLKWKKQIKLKMAAQYQKWLRDLHNELRQDVIKRADISLTKHVQGLGMGVAYLMSMRPLPLKSHLATHTDVNIATSAKLPIRRLRSGLIPHLLIMKYMRDMRWHRMTHEERLDEILCPCSEGVQDVRHVFEGCTLLKHQLTTLAESILTAAEKLSPKYAARIAAMTAQERVTEVLHATGSAHLGARTATMIRVWGKAVDTYLTAMTSALEPGLQAEET